MQPSSSDVIDPELLQLNSTAARGGVLDQAIRASIPAYSVMPASPNLSILFLPQPAESPCPCLFRPRCYWIDSVTRCLALDPSRQLTWASTTLATNPIHPLSRRRTPLQLPTYLPTVSLYTRLPQFLPRPASCGSKSIWCEMKRNEIPPRRLLPPRPKSISAFIHPFTRDNARAIRNGSIVRYLPPRTSCSSTTLLFSSLPFSLFPRQLTPYPPVGGGVVG